VKSYLNTLRHFVLWLDVPIEEVTHKKVLSYVDDVLHRRLAAKTINCQLARIRVFYDYLSHEEGIQIPNPIRRVHFLRQPKALPRHLTEEQLVRFLEVVNTPRDRAVFMLMLRCGLRVAEVADLTLGDLDLRRARVLIQCGKGAKGRVVYLSNDAHEALVAYLKVRPSSRAKRLFLAEKAPYRGKPISVRGIQKRMEAYAKRAKLQLCCHQLRHTMATQLLNADAHLITIQDLLAHNRITTTQRYCRVSNAKVQRDYFKAMEEVMRTTQPQPPT